MAKVNIKNERVKRKFFAWLKEADGRCNSTIDNIEKSILLYEDFTRHADFVTYGPDKAMEFKKWLGKRQFKGNLIAVTTYYSYVKNLHKFFLWLSWQAGYKSRITPDLVNYLKVTDKEKRIATQSAIRNYPPLEYVTKLANSIKINSEVDLRDRALISFTLLSGMRDKAIATLPLGCFDEDKLVVNQNPRQGVQTKFSKAIFTVIFKFDNNLLGYVIDWAKHLKSKGFGSQAPLFPRSKADQGIDNLCFEPASEVEPVFWQGASRIREIFKRRAQEAGLEYFPPHTFRHSAVDLAFKHCRTGDQIKAISQNFGHEHIATTLSSYGNYDTVKLSEILKKLNFSEKPKETLEEKVEELLKELKKK